MKDQDEVLVDILREMQEERGRTGGFDDSRLREKLEVRGESTTRDVLQAAITTIVLDRLGTSWDYYFGKLQAYKEQYGNCLVPKGWELDEQLSNWVVNQRAFNRRGQLSPGRVERLDSIGFVWRPDDAIWDKRYEQLVEFKIECGHCDVPTEKWKNTELSHWVSHQRRFRKRNELSQDRIDRLNAIGFSWNVEEVRWNKNFRKLAHGEAVADHWKEHQRKGAREGNLSKKRVNLLKSVGFSFDPYPDVWRNNLKALQDFHAKFKHWNVPKKYDKPLCAWVGRQRTSRKSGELLQDRIDRLDAIGFDWRTKSDQEWDSKFDDLVAYKDKFGHCDVPYSFKEDPALGHWVYDQKRLAGGNYYRNGRVVELRSDRRKRLEEIGFNFEVD